MYEAIKRHILEGEGFVDITVFVKPDSRFTGLKLEAGELVFYTEEPPIEGRANASLVRYLSRVLGVQTRSIEVVYGVRSRSKRVRVRGLDAETTVYKLMEALRASEEPQ